MNLLHSYRRRLNVRNQKKDKSFKVINVRKSKKSFYLTTHNKIPQGLLNPGVLRKIK